MSIKLNQNVYVLVADVPVSGKIIKVSKRSVEVLLDAVYYVKVTMRKNDFKESMKIAERYAKDYA